MQALRLICCLLLVSVGLAACSPAEQLTPKVVPTATATHVLPTSTIPATAVPTNLPTPVIEDEQERLAYIEGNQLVMVQPISGAKNEIAGTYRQLLGWSPGGRHLLAMQGSGELVVMDPSGNILARFAGLPQPAFWARPGDLDDTEDWLAIPRPDSSLELLSFPSLQTHPLLEPGSLGADGQADARWGSNGNWIVTPSLMQLQNRVSFERGYFSGMTGNGPDAQNLAVGFDGGTVSWDFHQEYFQVLDSVPGSPLNHLVGFIVEQECSSCQSDGMELVTLDPWSGEILPQGAVMLNTREAYAWNPAQPGLLAIAEGGSRFTIENKRLALLDVPTGQLRHLTMNDQAVFEPTWSPDGRLLAYTTLLSPEGDLSGSGQEMEARLGGRAIAVYGLQSDAANRMTSPAQDEIDGWPQWTADGKGLLYARKRLLDNTTEIRRVEIASGKDVSLFSIQNAPQACHRHGCGWSQMLAYTPGKTDLLPDLAGPVLSPTPTASIQTDEPRPGWNTYYDPGYGFSFQYPADWKVSGFEGLSNYLTVEGKGATLVIGYRRAQQQARIQRTGVGSGDLVPGGSIQFLGQPLERELLVYGGKTKEVLYQNGCEFSAGTMVFSLNLTVYDLPNEQYENVNIPIEVQREADQILESFKLETPDGSVP